MSASSIPNDVQVIEDSGVRWMARILAVSGSAILQANVSTIAYSVFDKSDPTTATATGTLTIASVIFDTLQTDSRWTKDETGYNFAWNVPASIFATGDKTYRIEVKITPTSGEASHIVRDFPVVALHRS
jgi:hypothetical protein